MPIYEYSCQGCGRPVAHLFRSFAAAAALESALRCAHCGGPLQRHISKPTLLRGSASRLAELTSEPALAALDAEEPAAMAQLLRAAGSALDEPLEGEMREIVGRLEAGHSPASIGAALPDLPTPPA